MAARFQELTNQLMDPTVLNQPGMIHKLNKERTELEEPAQHFAAYRELKNNSRTWLCCRTPSTGADMKQLFAEESQQLNQQVLDLESLAKDFLTPKIRATRRTSFWKSGQEQGR